MRFIATDQEFLRNIGMHLNVLYYYQNKKCVMDKGKYFSICFTEPRQVTSNGHAQLNLLNFSQRGAQGGMCRVAAFRYLLKTLNQ